MKLPNRSEITKVPRRARLAHATKLTGADAPGVEWPDLRARRRTVFGRRMIKPGGAQLVIEGRGHHDRTLQSSSHPCGHRRRVLKEHAWKLIPLARADPHRNAPTHSRSTTSRNNDVRRSVPVNHGVWPGFEGVSDTVLTQKLIAITAYDTVCSGTRNAKVQSGQAFRIY